LAVKLANRVIVFNGSKKGLSCLVQIAPVSGSPGIEKPARHFGKNGIHDVKIVSVGGFLGEHYKPSNYELTTKFRGAM